MNKTDYCFVLLVLDIRLFLMSAHILVPTGINAKNHNILFF